MDRRLKVIVGAYACNPAQGSEAGVGWGWVEAISRFHDLWVLTDAHNRGDIEEELARHPELTKRLHFEYVPRFRFNRLERISNYFYQYTYRNQWLPDAFKRARELHSRISFDLAHQLTYVGFRFPGHLWQMDIPFVWGPIGGLEQTNWRLLPALGGRGMIYYTARNLFNEFDRRIRRAPRLAFRKAKYGVIAATSGIQNEIQRFYSVPSEVIPEIGFPPMSAQQPTNRAEGQPLQLVWSGNHLPGKALPMLLKALARIGDRIDWNLCVLGSGACSNEWRAMSDRLGLDQRIHWTGKLSREQALSAMQRSHVLVISSVYDLTSTVLVEALANGIPVICPDHCGFKDAIDDSCGIKVPAVTTSALVAGLEQAIVKINDEKLRFILSVGSIQRSKRFEWEQKAALVDEIYREKMNKKHAGIEYEVSSNSLEAPLSDVR